MCEYAHPAVKAMQYSGAFKNVEQEPQREAAESRKVKWKGGINFPEEFFF